MSFYLSTFHKRITLNVSVCVQIEMRQIGSPIAGVLDDNYNNCTQNYVRGKLTNTKFLVNSKLFLKYL